MLKTSRRNTKHIDKRKTNQSSDSDSENEAMVFQEKPCENYGSLSNYET